MKVSPLFDRVLLRPVDEGNVTTGGLAIPDVARKSSPMAYGEVLAVGPGRYNAEGKLLACTIKAGDTVLYPRHLAKPIPMPPGLGDADEEVYLLREPEVLALIDDLPRDTGITDPEGRRILAMNPRHLRTPQVTDNELEGREVDAKLKEEGWDDGIGMDGEAAEG